MIFVRALQGLAGNHPHGKAQAGSSFARTGRGADRSLNFAVKNLATLADHDRAVRARSDDRVNNLAGSFRDRVELSVPAARGAIVGANPERARSVCPEGEYAT